MINNHCVYTHTSPSGKVYVGQTINTRRRWGYNGEHYRNKKIDGSYVQEAFARAIDKYGWDAFEHSIILNNISKKEADYAEKYLIKWYKLHKQSYNITDGGEGVCGLHAPLSEKAKEKLLLFLHTTPPMKGKHHSEETKAKISAAFKGKKLSDDRKRQMSEISKGRKHSDESKAKMSKYKKAHPESWIGGWNKIEVHQYDVQGNYLHSFFSAEEAAKSIGKKSGGDICKCLKNESASAHGYVWKTFKVDKIDLSNYKVIKTDRGARLIDMSKDKREARSAAHGSPVNQYSIDGQYIATFCSASEAARQTNSNLSGILRCCQHLPRFKTANGYKWEFDCMENRENIIVNKDDVRLKEKQIAVSSKKKS